MQTPCSNNPFITESSIFEFSSIFCTRGATRSWANLFTVMKEEKKACKYPNTLLEDHWNSHVVFLRGYASILTLPDNLIKRQEVKQSIVPQCSIIIHITRLWTKTNTSYRFRNFKNNSMTLACNYLTKKKKKRGNIPNMSLILLAVSSLQIQLLTWAVLRL